MYKDKYKINNIFINKLFNNMIFVCFANWIFQGIREKSSKEFIFNILFESILFLLIILVFKLSFYLSFIISHSISWIINNNLLVVLRYSDYYSRDVRKLSKLFLWFILYIKKNKYIESAIVIGSYTTEYDNLNPRSDLDVRIFFKEGFFDFLIINFILIFLRIISVFKLIPLDIYAIDNLTKLSNFSKKEKLYLVKDNKKKILNFMQENFISHELFD